MNPSDRHPAPDASPPRSDPALADRAVVAMLEQLLADRTAGVQRPLRDYLPPDSPFQRELAREWLAAAGDGNTAAALATPATAPDVPTIGPYRLRRELGRGGQGIVYLAEDTRLHRTVALKVVRTPVASLAGAVRLRWQREIEAMSAVDHPGLATVLDFDRDEAQVWFAMRYVPGGSLQQRLAAQVARGDGPPHQRADLLAAVRLVARAARALAAAHAKGLLHRDLKPGNVLLAADDEPVLADFGMASIETTGTPQLTADGALLGTLCYLPPERLGGAAASACGDVYSLGAVLFELLTLQRPHQAATHALELAAIGTLPAPSASTPNPAVWRDLDVVVATALASPPERRYQTAAAFADDLERLLAGRPISACPTPAWTRLRLWARRNRALATSLTAAAAATLLGLAGAIWQWQQTAAALADVHRLADLRLARELRAQAATLWPATPERAPAMAQWLADAVVLLAHRDAHERRLQALPPAPADATTEWQREQLHALIAELRALSPLCADLGSRRDRARTLHQRTVDAHAAAWRAAATRLAADPRFAGLALTPQQGLVPLGPDPISQLEEFAVADSGTVPQRAADGSLAGGSDDAIVLVLLPGGDVVLGAEARPPADGHAANVDADAGPDVGPSHRVTLSPYLFGKFELTQAQWQRHTGANPSTYHPGGPLPGVQSLRHPVEQVTWLDADRVLRELGLQLPSEAQWERAYRAGTTTRFPSGDDERSLAGRENFADRTAAQHNRGVWRCVDWVDDGYLVHAPVGSFAPNAFGLCDLGGNVREWCADSWEDYPDCVPRPGDGLRLGRHDRYRVVRGGAFSSPPFDLRAAHRGGNEKTASGDQAGLRAARVPSP